MPAGIDDRSASRRHHRRFGRPRTFAERLRLLVEMPRLTRAERNQRLAIVVVVILVGVYFLLRPLIGPLIEQGNPTTATPAVKPVDPPLRRNGK